MKLHFSLGAQAVVGDIEVKDSCIDFFIWLAKFRNEGRTESILTLIAEYDRENNKEERENILKTLVEIVENKPLAMWPDKK
jgi:hypothetical protein